LYREDEEAQTLLDFVMWHLLMYVEVKTFHRYCSVFIASELVDLKVCDSSLVFFMGLASFGVIYSGCKIQGHTVV
jgi:hypothetical protein